MIIPMTQMHHSCPTCNCSAIHLRPWLDQTLTPTGNPNDLISATQLYGSYLDWLASNPHPEFWVTQNGLTKWLKQQRLDIQTRGGRGNYLSGYTLRR